MQGVDLGLVLRSQTLAYQEPGYKARDRSSLLSQQCNPQSTKGTSHVETFVIRILKDEN